MEDMTQVQLSTAQRAPSDIPSGPNDDACCCRIAKDEGQSGGGMRVPQHWRCQGWLGGAVVGCTRRWRRTRRPHAAESPARRTADPVPSSKRRRPPRTLQAVFSFKTIRPTRLLRAHPLFCFFPLSPSPALVRPRILEAPAIACTNTTVPTSSQAIDRGSDLLAAPRERARAHL